MAANRFRVVTPADVDSTAVLKTVLQLVAPTNQRLKVDEWGVSFKGSDPAAVPVLVELIRQTSAGTATATTPRPDPDDLGDSLQLTAAYNHTVEPTDSSELLAALFIHPHGGGFAWQAPYDGELIVAGGGRLGLRVTAAAAVDLRAHFYGVE